MGQNSSASLGILDSQTVRWGNNRPLKSFDGNKKVKGVKALLLMRLLKYFLCSIKIIIADGGYRGELADEVKRIFGYVINVVMRKDDKTTHFKPVSKRWVIERIFSWFYNDRRLCRNYELLFESSENMVKLSAIKLLLNKI
jgi:transposase